MSNYVYIDCVDLKFCKTSIINALNIFKEFELEKVSNIEFKNKTKL